MVALKSCFSSPPPRGGGGAMQYTGQVAVVALIGPPRSDTVAGLGVEVVIENYCF